MDASTAPDLQPSDQVISKEEKTSLGRSLERLLLIAVT
jgi:hypothetical protein